MGFESPTTAHIITLAQRAEHHPLGVEGVGSSPTRVEHVSSVKKSAPPPVGERGF